MSELLKDKVAVITGSTRGLGLAIAQAFVREGAHVVISSRSQKSVEHALNVLNKPGGQASGITCDVAQRPQVEALADYTIQTQGRFDIWINNAGIAAPYGPTVHIDPEIFVKVLQTNILGTYFGTIVALRHLLPRREGKLINILGRGDTGAVPMQSAYTSSKTWVRTFTQALAKEYPNSGVGIFAYNPGLMETDLMERVQAVKGFEDKLSPLNTIMRMWANPPSVPAEKVVWLASAATDGRTGMVVKELTLVRMLSGLVQEGLRRLTGQNEPDTHLEITSVPAELPIMQWTNRPGRAD